MIFLDCVLRQSILMLNLGMGFLSMVALLALVIWDLTSGNQVTLKTRMVVMMVIAMMIIVMII